uniref:MOB kinase activator-like 4 n=1 Tax=Schistosoma haematobium TaxID=6185 RepID=A0A094ZNM2_SCHHA
MELNGLAVCLQEQCTPKTCPQMTATEQWIFLCAAHKTPKECPAVDYTRHTLDGAACLLNSSKYFPSRVSIKVTSVNRLDSVCRRVYRIFSHAYYHHREIFDSFEESTALCRRFTTFVLKYNLMSKDNLIVPIAVLSIIQNMKIVSRYKYLFCINQIIPQYHRIFYSNQTTRITNYIPLIGLEIHAQLSVHNKLFTYVPYSFGAPPNTQLGLHDVAIPGSMPHYFYTDLPAGYQITQYYKPISINGYLDYIWLRDHSIIEQLDPLYTEVIHSNNNQYYYRSHARIKCIQIEQDTGKSLHNIQRDCSLIDLNRSDVGLIEIVTEPDFNSSDQVAAFIMDLSRLLRHLKCCNAIGAFGELRVDVNVSIGQDIANQNPRVEIKNIGTIHGVISSIDYEIKRQSEILNSGGQITQETRSYDPVDNVTLRMRDKELAQDYRYIPEPNLPSIKILSNCLLCSSQSSSASSSESSISLSNNQICIQCIKQKYHLDSINSIMNLPQYKKQLFLIEYGLSLNRVIVLIDNNELCKLYELTLNYLMKNHLNINHNEQFNISIYAKELCYWITDSINSIMNLPQYKKQLFLIEYGLSLNRVIVLIDNNELCKLYELTLNYLMKNHLNINHNEQFNISIYAKELCYWITVEQLAEFVQMNLTGQIFGPAAVQLLNLVIRSDENAYNSVHQLAVEHDLILIKDPDQIKIQC